VASAAVAQQCRLSVQASDVAADAAVGSWPPGAHAPAGPRGASVVTRPAMVPSAVHRTPTRHDTAVTSVVPVGTACDVQAVPPSVVVRMTPGPTPVPPACPTAVHARGVAQAMSAR